MSGGSSEMVERVALALCASDEDNQELDTPVVCAHSCVTCRNMARAAIKAITTPSDSELDHLGRAALCGWNNVDPDNETMAAEWERMGPATREAWMRAMRRAIAALKDSP